MLNPLLFSPLLNLKGTKPNIQRPPLINLFCKGSKVSFVRLIKF